jgi:hypothetical protein
MIKRKHFHQPVNRVVQVATGLPITILGLLAIGVAGLILYVFFTGESVPRPILWFGIIILPVGFFCLLIAWRLFIGYSGRKDGGLFSPVALRIAGAIFLIQPVLLFFAKSYWILESITCVLAAYASFALASQRESKMLFEGHQEKSAQQNS